MKDVWGALSDGTRRKILNLLKERDMTAGEIAEQFELSNATISHHLSILKGAELIVGEKHGQTITYSLNVTVFQAFLKSLSEFLDRKGE